MPPATPAYRIAATKRMKQGLLPEAVQARERMLRGGQAAQEFSRLGGVQSVAEHAPAPDFQQGTKPVIDPGVVAAGGDPGMPLDPRANTVASKGIEMSTKHLGGMSIPLGEGMNKQAGNERAGQHFTSFFNKGKEYHQYDGGQTVAFARKPSEALNLRAKTAVQNVANEQDAMSQLAAAAAAAKAATASQQMTKARRPLGMR